MKSAPKRADNAGFASGLEKVNGKVLQATDLKYHYEEGPCVINYTLPIRGGQCDNCGNTTVVSHHKYTADFAFYTKSGKLIHIECKGHPLAWTGKTRSKHVAIRKQFPEMDLRFVFNNKHGKISKSSKTTNAEWCKRQGFLCESNLIPLRWINE